MADLNKLVDELSNLTLVEAGQLAKMLRVHWDIQDKVLPLMKSANDVIVAVEQEYYNVILRHVGPRKIEVIKGLRLLLPLGLAEAKSLAETPDAEIFNEILRDDAEKAAAVLRSYGAIVDIV